MHTCDKCGRTGSNVKNDPASGINLCTDKHRPSLADVLEDIAAERRRQDEKWGPDRDLDAGQWLAILMEEVGESGTEVCHLYSTNANPHLTASKWVARRTETFEKLRAELIQVAAVSVAMAEWCDRKLEALR